MAVIPYRPYPTVEPQAPREVLQDIPAATPGAFGGLIGAAEERAGARLEQSSNELAGAAVQRQMFYNQVVADDATNKFMDQSNALLRGDPSVPGDTGFFGKHGEDAAKAYPQINQQLQQLREQLHNGLPNQHAQLQFDEYTRRISYYLQSEMSSHYDQEQKVYANATNAATADAALRSITANPEDGGVYNEALKAINGSYIKTLQNAGQADNPVLVKDAQLKAQAAALTGRIDALIKTNPALAQHLLDNAPPGVLLGQQYDALAGKLQSQVRQYNVGAAVNEALGLPPPPGMIGSGRMVPKVTPAQVALVADNNGVDPSLAIATASIESGFGANVGTRGNIFQLGPQERASVGASGMGSPIEQLDYGTRFLADKKRDMSIALGRDPSNFEIYLAHQQGTGGALGLLSKPETRAGDIVGDAAIRANGGNPDAPAWQFVDLWHQKYIRAEKNAAGFVPEKRAENEPPLIAQVTIEQGKPTVPPDTEPDYATAVSRVLANPNLTEPERRQALSDLSERLHIQNYLDEHNELVAQRRLRITQASNEADLFARATPGSTNPPTDQELSEAVRGQRISVSAFNAIREEKQRAVEGVDDPQTVIDLGKRLGAGENVVNDIYAARQAGSLKGTTAATLIRENATQQREGRNQLERSAFATLRTIAGGDAVEKGILNFGDDAHKAQIQLWAQAQTEWTKRVMVDREDPARVLADMAPRYGHPIEDPAALPHPRFGAIRSDADIQPVFEATRAAHTRGELTDGQYDAEADLINNYRKLFADQQKKKEDLARIKAQAPANSNSPAGRVLGTGTVQ